MKIKDLAKIEQQRRIIQREIDLKKTDKQRNVLGQFSTPFKLANDIFKKTTKFLGRTEKIRFLDPAVGTGVFFSALINNFSTTKIEIASGYEIDEFFGNPSLDLWSGSIFDYRLDDFTKVSPPLSEKQKYNLIICNPPYVRHHHINGQKERLQQSAIHSANMKLSGLSGLYCYFMALAHRWLKTGGIAGWLVPSEFMGVNYGQAVRKYLLTEVNLLQIHRFNPKDVQFNDALVSSCVVWFQKKETHLNQKVKFTFGSSFIKPETEKEVSKKTLSKERKWTRFPLNSKRSASNTPKIGDFFSVKRGIATGNNNYFILTKSEIEKRNLPISQFQPILPSPKSFSETEVNSDISGFPAIDNKLFVLDCKLSIEEINYLYPTLFEYLQEGINLGISEGYLCRKRKIWYSQEIRQKSYFYCKYIWRLDEKSEKVNLFILNHSKAIVSNSYLILYPKTSIECLIEKDFQIVYKIHQELNNTANKALLDEGRVYGGGMYKLEPKELENVSISDISYFHEK